MSKKTFVAAVLIFSAALSANAQLQSTHWMSLGDGKAQIAFTIEFGKDSAILRSADSTLFEKMSFKVEGDKLNLRKAIGSTACSTEDVALYDLDIKDNGMDLRLFSDPCGQRSVVLVRHWTRQSK